jgi:hypothetical protein
MKRKALIIGALIAVLFIGAVNDAGAQRWGCRRGYGYGFRPPRVWIAPPPVVVVGPRFGYGNRYYDARPGYGRGYYGRPYAYRSNHYRRW